MDGENFEDRRQDSNVLLGAGLDNRHLPQEEEEEWPENEQLPHGGEEQLPDNRKSPQEGEVLPKNGQLPQKGEGLSDNGQLLQEGEEELKETESSEENESELTEGKESVDSSLIASENSKVAEDLEDDLACSVCLQLAVQPTTLVCGHTSCRICLARWYFTSKKKVCPLCRQEYHGLPKVNIQIRKMIYRLYPEKAKQREEELDADEDVQSLIKKYDEELQEARNKLEKDTDLASFCSGIASALCCFVVIYLAWYWQSSDSNLLVLKPVQTWRPNDVSEWLEDLNWASTYSEAAQVNHIDGKMLISISETDLVPYLNMTNPVHQKAFLFAVELLREEGVKMPTNLWEYKAIYPGRSLFLVYSMKDFPRTSLLYMSVYFYDDMFLPFVRATTGKHSSESQPGSSQEEEISTSQWVTFIVYAVLVPEWLVIVFAMQMFSQHFFSPLFAIATAVLYQVLEFFSWVTLFQNLSIRSLYEFGKQHLKKLMSSFMFMVLWPIIPKLICDAFFYGALYISPIQASLAVYQKLQALNQ